MSAASRAQFARTPEGCDRFGGAMTVRDDHRVSIGNLQPQRCPPVFSFSPTPAKASIISIALPRCAIASLNAER